MDVDISCVDETAAILYYDHLITFFEELQYIWRRPLSMASAWFLVNRYTPFLGNVVVLVIQFDSFGNEVRTSLRRELDRDCQSSALVQTLLSPRGQFGLLDDGQSC